MNFDFQTIGTAIAGVVAGVGGLRVFDFFLGKKKESRYDFKSIITTYGEDNERLRLKMDAMESELKAQKEQQLKDKEEIHKLSMKLQLMESAHYDLPIPSWLKDTNGVMLALNPAYEELFLRPLELNPSDYIGKTDIEFWGEKVGKQFMNKDQQVFRQGKSELVIEHIPLPNGEFARYLILKYVRMAGNVKIGIAGMAFKEMKKHESI